MITSLTPEQENKMPDYVAKWIAKGIDCSPLNMNNLRKAVDDLYTCGGLTPPKDIKVFSGPINAMIAINIYFTKEAMPKKKGESEKEYKDRISRHVKDNCFYATCGFGQQDAGWLSFYDFFRNECGLIEQTDKLNGLFQMADESNWYWAYENIIFISEKPTICKLDDNNLIHNEKGPAISYNDGTEIYAIHGVVVEKYVVMEPEKITLEDINNTNDNDEVRRTKTERFGVSRYLDEMKAEVVSMDMVKVTNDEDSPAMPRALIRTKGGMYLVGTDGSTKRTYHMRVNDNVKTPGEAHNSISPVDESNIIASS